MKWPHVHWHKLAGHYGLFYLPFWECRCGSRKYGGMW